jgi:uncharacterized protein YggU (UPF0235/DUF167 family)
MEENKPVKPLSEILKAKIEAQERDIILLRGEVQRLKKILHISDVNNVWTLDLGTIRRVEEL